MNITHNSETRASLFTKFWSRAKLSCLSLGEKRYVKHSVHCGPVYLRPVNLEDQPVMVQPDKPGQVQLGHFE